ncbi:NusG domain II-containing protein [Herbinix luporum]|jgi:hypothetical protein|uniref:Putative membrane protein n=1 Tax=Herbinix luporum TaxID=1679721 RepID=A0A0K8J5E1_9FIRM|nr:NusG domain II-containing protein [Herbinix luporum]MDI9488410.1 NusG domain II-containing protein [Bacillota bacterium]CUH92563.1 putative membrane protein [Herbinix luporum]HHT56798.1 NusG domain II-containing protein [Herbinix luporum]
MKKNDLYLIVGILTLIGISFLIINLYKTSGSKVIITVDGKEHKVFNLKEDTIYKIEHDNGHWNTIEIKDGYVKMLDASCPDKLCVMHKKIQNNNESITCLPNKVVLRIIDGKEKGPDAVAN